MKYYSGNSVELIKNGEEYFPAILRAIQEAKSEILFQTYIFKDDFIGREVLVALTHAARLGVRVHLCVDGFGSQELSSEFIKEIQDSGIRFTIFKPLPQFYWLGASNIHRLHRKIAVMDSRIAFIGGINVAEDQLIHSGPNGRLDYACRLEGPIVEVIQRYARRFHFRMENRWKKIPAHLKDSDSLTGDLKDLKGSAQIAFQIRDNFKHRRKIELGYRHFFKTASSEIIIAMAYFFPGIRFLLQMRRAVKRGLSIKLIVQGKSEFRILKLATEFIYPRLLSAGVEIYEYEPHLLHAKVAVIDQRISIVGSGNLDPLSLLFNLESNVIVEDEAFAQKLDQDLKSVMMNDCAKIEKNPRSFNPLFIFRFLSYLILRYFPLVLMRLSRRNPHLERPELSSPHDNF